MYKIMTKLHTTKENVFAFYMVPTDSDEKTTVEYKVVTPEEAKETALKLLGRVGYEDLRIVDDKSYYLDLLWGVKPEPAKNLYILEFVNDGEGYIADPAYKDDIEEETTVKVLITFDSKPDAFHLVLDEKEYKTGLPSWISYEEIDDLNGYLYFNGITRDHKVELIIDSLIDKPVSANLDYISGLVEGEMKIYGNSILVKDAKVKWYEADPSVGRMSNGNRFGFKITAPEEMEYEDYKDAVITRVMTYTDREEVKEMTFDQVKDTETYYECWPIITTDLEKIDITIQWSEERIDHIVVHLENIELEEEPTNNI